MSIVIASITKGTFQYYSVNGPHFAHEPGCYEQAKRFSSEAVASEFIRVMQGDPNIPRDVQLVVIDEDAEKMVLELFDAPVRREMPAEAIEVLVKEATQAVKAGNGKTNFKGIIIAGTLARGDKVVFTKAPPTELWRTEDSMPCF